MRNFSKSVILLSSLLLSTAFAVEVIDLSHEDDYDNGGYVADNDYNSDHGGGVARANPELILQLKSELQAMRAQVQELQGRVEEQQHQLSELKTLPPVTGVPLNRNPEAAPRGVQPPPLQDATNVDAMRDVPPAAAAPTAMKRDDGAVTTSAAATHTAINIPAANDHEIYSKAYEHLKTKDYDLAIFQLQQYLAMFPNGQYVTNAYYWMGEAYMLKGSYNKALEMFDLVVKNYPLHEKAGDALFKKGVVYFVEQKYAAAKIAFVQVTQRYPDTTLSKLAAAKLDQIKQLTAG